MYCIVLYWIVLCCIAVYTFYRSTLLSIVSDRIKSYCICIWLYRMVWRCIVSYWILVYPIWSHCSALYCTCIASDRSLLYHDVLYYVVLYCVILSRYLRQSLPQVQAGLAADLPQPGAGSAPGFSRVWGRFASTWGRVCPRFRQGLGQVCFTTYQDLPADPAPGNGRPEADPA